MPARAVLDERARLWAPPQAQRLDCELGLSDIVSSANEELRQLLPAPPQLQLRVTATDSCMRPTITISNRSSAKS
jgi:hypothetical protein